MPLVASIVDDGDVPSDSFGGLDADFLIAGLRLGSGIACDSYLVGRSTLSLLGCLTRAADGLEEGVLAGRVRWYDCERFRGVRLAAAPDGVVG